MKIKVGDKFGTLEVLEIISVVGKHGKRALCRCSCGDIRDIDVWSLGVCKYENHSKCRKIKIGSVFGNLKVLEIFTKKRTSSDKTDRMARCECICGKIREVHTHYLFRCHGKNHCRCEANEVKCGDKFGMLTVLEKLKGKGKGKRAMVACRCDCGKLYYAQSVTSLMRMKNKSCGCTWDWKKGKNNPRWCGYEELPNKYWYRVQAGAKVRGIKFKLTRKQIWDLFIKQNRRCVFSGVELQFLSDSGCVDITASLDRIDSTKGYTIDNVQWVHKDIQFMKQEMMDDEFVSWCRVISNYQINHDIVAIAPSNGERMQKRKPGRKKGDGRRYGWALTRQLAKLQAAKIAGSIGVV